MHISGTIPRHQLLRGGDHLRSLLRNQQGSTDIFRLD
jgi:hypothetical protein